MNYVTVAVQAPLEPFEQALTDAGFIVVPLTQNSWHDAQAVVVHGMDDHFLGMAEPNTRAPVINADGLTPDEVVGMVRRQLWDKETPASTAAVSKREGGEIG